MNMNKKVVTSRRLDCVSPTGLRRTLYAGYRTEEKEKSYFEGFLKQLEKFSLKRNAIILAKNKNLVCVKKVLNCTFYIDFLFTNKESKPAAIRGPTGTPRSKATPATVPISKPATTSGWLDISFTHDHPTKRLISHCNSQK